MLTTVLHPCECNFSPDNVLGCARTGNIVFSGKVGTVILASSGTGRVYVSGVSQAVNANMEGLGTAVIDAASGDSFSTSHT